MGIELSRRAVETWILQKFEGALPLAAESGLVLLAAGVLYLVARWVLRRLELHLTARTETELDDCLLRLVRRCFLASIGFWSLWRLAQIWTLDTISKIVTALWIVALSFLVSRCVSELLEIFERKIVTKADNKLDDTALPLLNKFIQFIIIGIGVLMALPILNISATPFATGAGVIGLALSFAAKDTLSNLIAGILLILDRPFEVGDRIEIWGAPKDASSWGDVEEIGLRATKIRTPDNLVVVIPNNEIMRRDIINYTASGDDIRLRLSVGIGYKTDAKLAKKLILGVADSIDGINKEPEPVVITRQMGDSSVVLQVRVWIANARRRRAIGDTLADGIKEAFDANQVEIPFPQHDVYIRSAPGTDSAALSGKSAGRATAEDGPK